MHDFLSGLVGFPPCFSAILSAGSSSAAGGRATSVKEAAFYSHLLYYPSINSSVLKKNSAIEESAPGSN